MNTVKIFIASSYELKTERDVLELFIRQRSDDWLSSRDIRFEVVRWENFIDAMSTTRLQNEYNKAIKDSHIFILLFFTKVGVYTEEEFRTALNTFKEVGKPLVYTYFKKAPINADEINQQDKDSLANFKKKLSELGHFETIFENSDRLKLHFWEQLEKLHNQNRLPSSPAVSNGSTANSDTTSSDDNQQLINQIKSEMPSSRSLVDLLEKYKPQLLEIDPEIGNEFILFSAEWNSLEKDNRMGIISSSDANIRRNRLSHRFLAILDSLV